MKHILVEPLDLKRENFSLLLIKKTKRLKRERKSDYYQIIQH